MIFLLQCLFVVAFLQGGGVRHGLSLVLHTRTCRLGHQKDTYVGGTWSTPLRCAIYICNKYANNLCGCCGEGQMEMWIVKVAFPVVIQYVAGK